MRAMPRSASCTASSGPVGGRHIIGHFLSTAVFGALVQVMPDRVMADGSANIWITQIIGEHDLGRQFAYVFFSSGGTGARANKDGISATAFPSGIRGVPAEIIENVLAAVHAETRVDSGLWRREYRGGLGRK